MKGFCAAVVGGLLTLTTSASWAQPTDAIDLSTVVVHGQPADIGSWPIGVQVTKVTMSPQANFGLAFDFEPRHSWPDFIPPSPVGDEPWRGPLQYTVWACVSWNGRPHCSGFIQMWRDRPSTGAPILSDWKRNWAYDQRWGEMAQYTPQPGHVMWFFLVAGNSRHGQVVETAVRQRSNVVAVTLPAGDSGVFTYPLGGAPPTSQPTPPAPPTPGGDVAALTAHVRALTETVDALRTWANERFALAHDQGQALESRTSTLELRVDLVERRPPPALKCHGYLNLLIVRVPFAACRVEPE